MQILSNSLNMIHLIGTQCTLHLKVITYTTMPHQSYLQEVVVVVVKITMHKFEHSWPIRPVDFFCFSKSSLEFSNIVITYTTMPHQSYLQEVVVVVVVKITMHKFEHSWPIRPIDFFCFSKSSLEFSSINNNV